jgi:hypothetical protein
MPVHRSLDALFFAVDDQGKHDEVYSLIESASE